MAVARANLASDGRAVVHVWIHRRAQRGQVPGFAGALPITAESVRAAPEAVADSPVRRGTQPGAVCAETAAGTLVAVLAAPVRRATRAVGDVERGVGLHRDGLREHAVLVHVAASRRGVWVGHALAKVTAVLVIRAGSTGLGGTARVAVWLAAPVSATRNPPRVVGHVAAGKLVVFALVQRERRARTVSGRKTTHGRVWVDGSERGRHAGGSNFDRHGCTPHQLAQAASRHCEPMRVSHGCKRIASKDVPE